MTLDANKANGPRMVASPHPATLGEEDLLKHVTLSFGRSSGPGGQHRNRKATACTMTHTPTGVSGEATERRRQSENRRLALHRLRRALAVELRTEAPSNGRAPSSLWLERRNGNALAVNPKHEDYPALLCEALDVVHGTDHDLAAAAEMLGVSRTQLTRLIADSRPAFSWLNEQRRARDLGVLKG